MKLSSEQKLFDIASAQAGYFTSQQAIRAGYEINNHPYYVKGGNWIKQQRGIFRLSKFPHQQEEQYVLWSLWSRNKQDQPQGVYSYETALSIYDVSDLMPAKLQMTVPKKFRRRSKIPNILILHQENLEKKDYQSMRGFQVTTPLKTLLDIITMGQVEEHIIKQSIQQMVSRGLITRRNILSIIERHPQSAKFFIEKRKIGSES